MIPTPLNPNNEGKILNIINFDELYTRSHGARILNNDDMLSKNYSKELTEAIYSNNDGDIGFCATCTCGALSGNYYEGAICPICNSEVSTAFADKLSHSCWIAIPDNMPPVLHPIVYMILKTWSTSKKNEPAVIDYLLDPTLEMPPDMAELIPKQGYTYFYNHYDEVIDTLLNRYPRTASKKNTHFIRLFLKKHRELIFCKKLPILHSSLHPITTDGGLRFVDTASKDALSAILGISYTSFTTRRSITHDKFVDTELYEAYKGYIRYIESIGQTKLGDKFAIFRHHIFTHVESF